MPPPPLTPARKLFNKYKKDMISELGRDATGESDLDAIGRRELGSAFAGVHPQDRVKLKPNAYYIVNTDTHSKPGQHWVAVKTTRKHAYIYDSYGRPVKSLVRHLINTINNAGYTLGKTDREPHGEQIGYSSGVCGQCSLAFLLVVRDLGIRAASEI